MTPYSDSNNPCEIDVPGRLKRIGWLSLEETFQTGRVSEEFFTQLCVLLINPWNPPGLPASACFSACELCQFSGYNRPSFYRGYEIPSFTSRSLYVPGDGFLYEAPGSIAHYIDAHRYRPPDEFCDAVMVCPPMRSREYLKKVLDNGGRELLKWIRDMAARIEGL